MEDGPYLKLILPGNRHRVVPISTDPFTLGRRQDNHLILTDEDISRVQAIIRREGVDYVIEDQKSLFGTLVNGEEIERRVLRNRDVISLGRERSIEIVYLHGDRMSRILNEVDRTPDRETSREELRNLQILLEVSRGLNSFASLNDLLELALDAVIDLTRAERGFVMLRDAEGGLRMQAARNMAGERILPENMRVSMSIVSEVMSRGSASFLTDALERSDLREKSSIEELRLRAISCLPIMVPAAHLVTRPARRPSRGGSDEILGVIYTDSSQAVRPIPDMSRELVESIAGHAAIAVETFWLRQEELEHRLLEKEMEKLREVDRLKSDFVSHVSHELRTPLTAIKGAIDNMLDGLTGGLNDKQARYLHRMKENTEHLVRLIEDILDISRIEAGQIGLELRPISISRLVIEVCDSLRPIAASRSIELAAEAPDDLAVKGDRDRLMQVLLNLVGNALKFTPTGGRVSASAEDAGEEVAVRVIDTGRGIEPELTARVFDRFYRVLSSESAEEGTGLGLSIAKSLVELHAGTIGVESTLGVGSTFTVRLPKSGPPVRPATLPSPATGAGGPAAGGEPSSPATFQG